MWIQDSTSFTVIEGSPGDSLAAMQSEGLELIQKMDQGLPLWYYLYFLVLFGIIAWVNVYYSSSLYQTFQASINIQVAKRMFNDNSQVQNQMDRVLSISYVLGVTFFIYYLQQRYQVYPYDLQGFFLYLFDLFLLILFIIVQTFILTLMGSIFNNLKLTREYLYNIYLYNMLTGVSLLPFLFLLVYTRGALQDVFFYLIIIALIAFTIMRLLRGIVLSSRNGVLIVYMFLYLCALEIAPLILLYRWLEGVL